MNLSCYKQKLSKPILKTFQNSSFQNTLTKKVSFKNRTQLNHLNKKNDFFSHFTHIVTSVFAPCMCVLELCIGWYPCGLKYCKGKNDNAINNNQINSSYRCGIKTCRKCSNFSYYVRQKQQCLWDE